MDIIRSQILSQLNPHFKNHNFPNFIQLKSHILNITYFYFISKFHNSPFYYNYFPSISLNFTNSKFYLKFYILKSHMFSFSSKLFRVRGKIFFPLARTCVMRGIAREDPLAFADACQISTACRAYYDMQQTMGQMRGCRGIPHAAPVDECALARMTVPCACPRSTLGTLDAWQCLLHVLHSLAMPTRLQGHFPD